METAEAIQLSKIKSSKIKDVNFENLGFGTYVSDHMFISEYRDGTWSNSKITPFDNITMAPTSLALHYGQTVFEGMKAFRMDNNSIGVFRIEKHYKRFCRSLERLCIPAVPYELFNDGLLQLVELDRNWVPQKEGASLYIRPFMFATEERFGVKISSEYKFIIFTGPVGMYYSKPLRVKVEDQFMRASRGGTGYAKCGGNYGASFYPAMLAQKQGFDQVIWTDGSSDLNIEESGTMNVMFVVNGEIITPSLSDTILEGVTRDSLLQIARDLGYKTREQKISTYQLREWATTGKLQEAFGVGTAAVTSPIKTISFLGTEYDLPDYTSGSFCTRAYAYLQDIRLGRLEDKHNWLSVIKA